MNFARNFSNLRKKMGLSQEQMAERCGVSRSALAKWESAESIPNITVIDIAAKEFGVTIDELVNGAIKDEQDNTYDAISKKLDNLQEVQSKLLEIVLNSNRNVNLYEQYRLRENDGLCYEMENVDNEILSDISMEEGYVAREKGNFTQACRYHEEALLLGNISAFRALINDYEEIISVCADTMDESAYYSNLLEFAVNVQQYGKIAEDLIRSGKVF